MIKLIVQIYFCYAAALAHEADARRGAVDLDALQVVVNGGGVVGLDVVDAALGTFFKGEVKEGKPLVVCHIYDVIGYVVDARCSDSEAALLDRQFGVVEVGGAWVERGDDGGKCCRVGSRSAKRKGERCCTFIEIACACRYFIAFAGFEFKGGRDPIVVGIAFPVVAAHHGGLIFPKEISRWVIFPCHARGVAQVDGCPAVVAFGEVD